MQPLQGIPAAPGIALGPSFYYQTQEIEFTHSTAADPPAELRRLTKALEKSKTQLSAVREKALQETGKDEAAIFDAHLMFLSDPVLLETVNKQLTENRVCCESAWSEAIEANAQQMEAMEDEYFRARAADIRDVGNRVLRNLLGIVETDLTSLKAPSIIVAKDLTPSDTVRLDKDLVLGFCTAEGGPTSHTAILAKALGLPAVVGLGMDILSAQQGQQLALDGIRGEVVIDPDPAARDQFEQRLSMQKAQAAIDLENASQPATTSDGHQVEVVANVGNIRDAETALQLGAEGIGLLRTEFLYLDRTVAPDEEQQYTAYHQILELMEDRPVVVRTLDVGGDKELPYLDLGRESNPFLGWRAIRMCLDDPDFFRVQLSALLRASPGHDLRIMFPMIATIDEVLSAKEILQSTMAELQEKGIEIADPIQVGIMVEIPSVALLADQFAQVVDFFSIGTNDLTQYTMAADRTNEKVAYLIDACHPAILRQIKMVIDAAHKEGRWVGLCGELAGDPLAIPILLGLGLDEFSMAPPAIPRAKAIIRTWSLQSAQELAKQVLAMENAHQVRESVAQFEISSETP